MAPDTPESGGLRREAVIETALEMLDSDGVDSLSMRALADRLGVKAASLYWHFRDKDQLLESVAETVLERFAVPDRSDGWRSVVAEACSGAAAYLAVHQAVAAVLLGTLPTVQRSRFTHDIAEALRASGLEDAETAAFALVVEVIATAIVATASAAAPPTTGEMTLAIDSGSWQVHVRAAASGATDVATSVGGGGAATIDVQPDRRVVVRGRRGGNRGAVELNPAYTWRVKLHGGTWKTLLDLRGLRISGIELDSGGGKIATTLPAPVGVVPITVNSGIVGVDIHRPSGAAVLATLHSGSVKVRLDDRTIRTLMSDVVWQTPGAQENANRYELTVHSGCVNVTLDATAPAEPVVPPASVKPSVETSATHDAVGLILDGIERRIKR